jgi:hypothetical protein
MRGMQERFRRNATAIEAHAAKAFVALNHDYFLAKIGCVKCCGVSTWSRADNDDFCFDWIH